MKTKTIGQLLTELAHIQKQIDEYDERAEIATRKIEETPYADEIRFVYAEIDRLDVRANVIRTSIRARVAGHHTVASDTQTMPGVIVKSTTKRTVTIDKDLSMYLEEEEDVTCT